MPTTVITTESEFAADRDGRRWYTHPTRMAEDSNPPVPERYISVSTVTDGGMSKPGLKYWAGSGAGNSAAEGIPEMLAALLTIPECGTTHGEGSSGRCRKCFPCLVRWHGDWHVRKSEQALERGSAVHSVLKNWALFGIWIDHDPDYAPYVGQIKQWIRDYGIRREDVVASEATVVHRRHSYAGTLDLIVTIHASRTPAAARLVARHTGKLSGSITVVVDLKTTENDDKALYSVMALQITAYRHAEFVLLADGTEVPMPVTTGGAILQVGAGWYEFEPCVTDDVTMVAFLGLLVAVRWDVQHGARSVGVKSFPALDEVAGTVAGHERVIRERKAADSRYAALKLVEADRRRRPAPAPARKAAAPRKAAASRKAAPAAPPVQPVRSVAERITGCPAGDIEVPF